MKKRILFSQRLFLENKRQETRTMPDVDKQKISEFFCACKFCAFFLATT